jgi:hypothetical protein
MNTQQLGDLHLKTERAQGARKFRLHFNKNNMRQGLPAVWTIHMHGQCIAAKAVVVTVETRTVYKGITGPQPRAWCEGQGVLVPSGEQEYLIVSPQEAAALRRTVVPTAEHREPPMDLGWCS